MRLVNPVNEGLEIYYNLRGSNWILSSARRELDDTSKGKSFGLFTYYSSKNRNKGTISLSVDIRDNIRTRYVELELSMSTPDDEFSLVFSQANQNVSTELIDINYILESVEKRIIDPLYSTISELDFGSILGAMIDKSRGFVDDLRDSADTNLRIILNDLDDNH